MAWNFVSTIFAREKKYLALAQMWSGLLQFVLAQ